MKTILTSTLVALMLSQGAIGANLRNKQSVSASASATAEASYGYSTHADHGEGAHSDEIHAKELEALRAYAAKMEASAGV